MALSAMPTAAGLRRESKVSQALGELGGMRSADHVWLHAQKATARCSLRAYTMAPSYFASPLLLSTWLAYPLSAPE